MKRSSIHALLLALITLAACNESGSGSAALRVRSISVRDGAQWPSNRQIELAFDRPIDFTTVHGESIRIQTESGVRASGSFRAKSIDRDGDGAVGAVDQRVVVFTPSCPLAEDLSDAGLTPGGVRYTLTVAGEDSPGDPGLLLRSTGGAALASTTSRSFETLPLQSALEDGKAGAPLPLVRSQGASTGPGCHLELGEDPDARVFFEFDSVFGRTPAGFAAPLNLHGDRASHVAFVAVFDQPIRPASANLARFHLDYNPIFNVFGWVPLETRAELVSNCVGGGTAVRLVPLGSFPPGGFVRVRIDAGLEDLVGESTPVPFDEFAIAEVARVAFATLDPAAAIADEVHEEFDFDAASPLSLEDPAPTLDAAPAIWGEGELRAGLGIAPLPPELSEFDWVVRRGETFFFDTTRASIVGGPNGSPQTTQVARDGLVLLRNLLVEEGGEIRAQGSNPLVLHVENSVSIRGLIDVSGFRPSGQHPGSGAHGGPGGGLGGGNSEDADLRGGPGSGARGDVGGGGGGESALAPPGAARGGCGGGGALARDQGALVAEAGSDGNGQGAETGLVRALGGVAGVGPFVDQDPENDFFGVKPVLDASGFVVARRQGELAAPQGGAGGGSGGDSVESLTFPGPAIDGGGGGGGGGVLVIRALGPILFGPEGEIRADGGRGAITGLPERRGAFGGSGSGGHVILESATRIDFTGGDSRSQSHECISAVGGPRAVPPEGGPFGGAGGPGIVQLHVPHPELAPGAAGARVILPSDALDDPDPLTAVSEPRLHVLYPTIGSLSRARSRWIPLGAAGEEGAGRPASLVAFLFGGLETASGEDEGKVLTAGGRVPEPAPLLGPASLARPDIALRPNGFTLALSGPVLGPLRESAEPIGPDVYLRTPALLAGATLRLANSSDQDRRSSLLVAAARYDDANAMLELDLSGMRGTLAATVAELGGLDEVELVLASPFFKIRQGPFGADELPDTGFVRILFQGAAHDGTGRPDEVSPLVDWTADVSLFGSLPPGALDFVRFQVEFELDADGDGFDPDARPLELDFLRLPFRY